jgi:Tfp pilus assembly protein PilV
MRINQSRNQAGLALVEIIITGVAAMIIIIAVSIILVYGQNSLDSELRRVDFQRNASYAMLRMRQAIRCAKKAELEDDGNIIKIYNNSGWVKYRFDPDNKNLLFQFDGENEQILLEGIVESATFQIEPVNQNAVSYGFTLKNGDLESQNASTTMMRNYGT